MLHAMADHSYSDVNLEDSRCGVERAIVDARSRADVERIDVSSTSKADQILFLLRKISLNIDLKTSYRKLIEITPLNMVDYRQLRELEGIHCQNVDYPFAQRQGRLIAKYAMYIANATMRNPNKMDEYVQLISIDSHSADRLTGMEISNVCKRWPHAFFSAISHLPPQESKWMRGNVIDQNCTLKLLPEAD